jgi:hypothetical protein
MFVYCAPARQPNDPEVQEALNFAGMQNLFAR